MQAVRYHDVLTFAIGPSGPVLQDVWCDGAYEWTEPRRRYVASASHRLLLEYPFSGWSPNQDVTLHELSW